MTAEGVIVLDDVLFEDLLSEAANAPDDVAAQAALTSHLQEVLETGDLERVMAVAMVVGATACLHPHLEDAARLFGDFDMDDDHEEDGHAHGLGNAQGSFAYRFGGTTAMPAAISVRALFSKVFST